MLTAATLWAYGIILMRQIARRETSLLQMLYTNGFFLAGTGLGTVVTWQTPTPMQFMLLGCVGILGGCGQFALFEAARVAPAAVMATVEYTALLCSFALGYAIWGDIPGLTIWIGACLILTAGAVSLQPNAGPPKAKSPCLVLSIIYLLRHLLVRKRPACVRLPLARTSLTPYSTPA